MSPAPCWGLGSSPRFELSCLPVQVWEGVQERGEIPALLLLPLGTPLPGHSMPFAATQKCFLVSISKRWDPGTHVAKPEMLGALSSCRRLQQAYFPSLVTHGHSVGQEQRSPSSVAVGEGTAWAEELQGSTAEKWD